MINYRIQITSAFLKIHALYMRTMHRVYYIWKSNADYVPDLLDQSCKRDKSLNYDIACRKRCYVQTTRGNRDISGS